MMDHIPGLNVLRIVATVVLAGPAYRYARRRRVAGE